MDLKSDVERGAGGRQAGDKSREKQETLSPQGSKLLHLQRTAGNQAVARMLTNPVIQRTPWWAVGESLGQGTKYVDAKAAAKKFDTDLSRIMTPDPTHIGAHAPDKLGLGEKFTVKAKLGVGEPLPKTVDGEPLLVSWQIVDRAHETNRDDKKGTLEAVAKEVGAVNLKLVGKSGSLQEKELALIKIPVNGPADYVSNKNFVHPRPSGTDVGAKMQLEFWFTPDDVCFTNLQWREPGGEAAVLSDNMAQVEAWEKREKKSGVLTHHGGNPNDPRSVVPEHRGRKNFIQQWDNVGNSLGRECAPGSFTWACETQYRVKDPVGSWVGFKTLTHVLAITTSGAKFDATISKAGQSHTEAGVG